MNAMSSARHWVVAAAISASLLAIPGVSSADPLPAGCTQAKTAGTVTCVFTSGTNEILLPRGVTAVTVTTIGGRGGDFTFDGRDEASSAGGRAAEVTATTPVPAGTRSLYVVVGGNGTSTLAGSDPTGGVGGANGGGTGGTTNLQPGWVVRPGAGGGGASDVRTAPDDLESRVVVAAGGGGGSYFAPGGDAGTPGRFWFDQVPAQAGAGTAGGSGGLSNGTEGWNGLDGSLGVGGAAGPRTPLRTPATDSGGGGGGGGLYGGGGGSFAGSGAGGSSLVPIGGTLALSDAPPSVTITYQPPVTPPVCTGSACLPAGLFGSS